MSVQLSVNSKQRNSWGTCMFLSKKLLFISRNRAEVLLSQSWLTAQTLPLSLKCKSTWCDCWKIFQIKCFPSYLHPNLYSKWSVNKAATQRETAKDSNCFNYFKWYISELLKCSVFCSCANPLLRKQEESDERLFYSSLAIKHDTFSCWSVFLC